MLKNIDSKTREKALKLIEGTYDLHIHPNPSHFKRKFDDFELVKELDEVKMAGAVIKTHYESTVGRAIIANAHAGGKAKLFGTVALNYPVGGLNPYAAESALNLGAKVIWMPTRDSVQHLKKGMQENDFYERKGISIYDENCKVKKEVYEILEVVKRYGATLMSGHLSVEETIDLCKITTKEKIRTILNHPEWDRTIVPLDVQCELAKMGVIIEKLWLMISMNFISAENMAHSIRTIGVKNVIMGTDSALVESEGPRDGNLAFIETMIQQGFGDDEIRHMARNLPKELINE